MNQNPCTDTLTDVEYLKHMIPHHQVAIDMSELLIPHISDPIMLNLCRNIIRVQKYEIWEMNMMLENISKTVFAHGPVVDEDARTKLDLYDPRLSRSKDGDCNPLFFKPDDHAKHMEHMEITSKSYLEHMIPHHQVAVDMSRRLLMHTNQSYLMEFCRKLIVEQQSEIYYMNNLLKNKFSYNYQSELLNN